eukprot:360488-Chlamydomonas_euryale.AAC.17
MHVHAHYLNARACTHALNACACTHFGCSMRFRAAEEQGKPEEQTKVGAAEQNLQPSGSNGKANAQTEGASTDTGDAGGGSGSKSKRCAGDAVVRSHGSGDVNVVAAATEVTEVEARLPSDTSFPDYAAKSIVGHRFGMEDTYTVIPNVVSVPKAWVRDVLLDQLPEQAAAGSKACANTGELKGVSSRDLEDGRYALHLFAVYDGHGGASVAEHCSKHLHEQLQRIVGLHADERKRQDNAILSSQEVILEHQPSEPAAGASGAAEATEPGSKPKEVQGPEQEPEPEPELIQMALTQAFLATDKELEQKQGATDMGTTAVVSLLGRRHLWVANAGDSRAVVARRSGALTLSSDHKANRKDEAVRLVKAVWGNGFAGKASRRGGRFLARLGLSFPLLPLFFPLASLDPPCPPLPLFSPMLILLPFLANLLPPLPFWSSFLPALISFHPPLSLLTPFPACMCACVAVRARLCTCVRALTCAHRGHAR